MPLESDYYPAVGVADDREWDEELRDDGEHTEEWANVAGPVLPANLHTVHHRPLRITQNNLLVKSLLDIFFIFREV